MSRVAPSIELDIGDLAKEYAVVREIGRGGMGAVLLGRHRKTGHLVAIKIASTGSYVGEEALARFARESRLMARFRHPNIVQLFDIRQLGLGRVGIVMEYVDGVSVASLVRQHGALEFELCKDILRDVARGLGHAHAHGVVHRDVKPQNVLVERTTGRAKLFDFGIAKALGDDGDVTATGAAIGTPAYMSPEQIDGRPIDGRSDLFSLGVLGWEVISGERPWAGLSLFQILFKQQREPLPSLTLLRPDTPNSLLLTLEGALEKEPALRWSSLNDMVEQLDSDQPTTALLERRRRAGASLQLRGSRPSVDSETQPLRRPDADTIRFAPPSRSTTRAGVVSAAPAPAMAPASAEAGESLEPDEESPSNGQEGEAPTIRSGEDQETAGRDDEEGKGSEASSPPSAAPTSPVERVLASLSNRRRWRVRPRLAAGVVAVGVLTLGVLGVVRAATRPHAAVPAAPAASVRPAGNGEGPHAPPPGSTMRPGNAVAASASRQPAGPPPIVPRVAAPVSGHLPNSAVSTRPHGGSSPSTPSRLSRDIAVATPRAEDPTRADRDARGATSKTATTPAKEGPSSLDRRGEAFGLATSARAAALKGRVAEAERAIDSALALDPRNGLAYLLRARLRIARKQDRDAWTDVELAERMGQRWEALSMRTLLIVRQDGVREARQRLAADVRDALIPERPLDAERAVGVAKALVVVGDTSMALAILERAAAPDGELGSLLRDPLFDPLRASARFARVKRGDERPRPVPTF